MATRSSSSAVCLFCQTRAYLYSGLYSQSPSWQPQRSVSHLRHRTKTPTRMTLSPKVAEPSTRKPRQREGPFASLNQTVANIPHRKDDRPLARFKAGVKERKSRPAKEGFHALKMQRTLSPLSYNQRTATKSRIAGIDSFDQFNLLPTTKESIAPQALRGMENITPTPIQRLAIPDLLGHTGKQGASYETQDESRKMEQYLLAAETGSGKTLAYLLPVIDAMKRAEIKGNEEEAEKRRLEKEEKDRNTVFSIDPPPLSNEQDARTGRPSVIILLPTAELVTQVGAIAKALSHTIKYRASMISTAYSPTVIRNRLFSPAGIDMLITTPHLLNSITKTDPNVLSRVTHLIVDEADSLLDRSFSPITMSILDRVKPSLQQLILCSATIPRSLDNFLRERFPTINRLTTPNLHAIPRRVQLGVVDVDREPYHGNKNLACAESIWSIGKSLHEHVGPDGKEFVDTKRILVFVNERETTIEVANYLVSKGIDAEALSRDTPEQRQKEILSAFTNAEKISVPVSSDKASGKGKSYYVPFNQEPQQESRNHALLPNTKALVVTDLGSRGIDTLAVRHVILYDVPHTTIDFIHRLGRTGRMGRRGRGLVLVGRHDRKDVVREVREGMFKGQALI
ncbi:MAG: RNA helicase [Cirrosporium novae-zelandiae]|nr:MAG: RNA helicase [Cirrosporium novae-zelandiae]